VWPSTPSRFTWRIRSSPRWVPGCRTFPRADSSIGDNVLIVASSLPPEPKTIVLRALGPSLSSFGVSGVLRDPVLSCITLSHTLIATNDNWQSDPHNADIQKNGFAPSNLLESATMHTLAPGAYTVIVTGKDSATGIGLVELYDLSPQSNSKLANMSTAAPRHGRQRTDQRLYRWRRRKYDGHCARPWSITWSFWCERSAKRSHTDDLRLDRLYHRKQRQLARRC